MRIHNCCESDIYNEYGASTVVWPFLFFLLMDLAIAFSVFTAWQSFVAKNLFKYF